MSRFCRGDGRELIGRLPKRKGVLELNLPFRVRARRCVHDGSRVQPEGEHFTRVIED
jgi:hypothetical protein